MDYKISLNSYLKLIMHALKYPYNNVDGLLLSKKQKENENEIEFFECIPLFHNTHGLIPMLRIVLMQVYHYCEKRDLKIAGYYFANKTFNDTLLNKFAQEVGQTLFATNNSFALIMLNSCKLVESLSRETLIENSLDLYIKVDKLWEKKPISSSDKNEEILNAIGYFIFENKIHLNIVDFEIHLHDAKSDYLNSDISLQLEEWQINNKLKNLTY